MRGGAKTGGAKTAQLQIRLTAAEKRTIQQNARHAELSVSEWVLSRILPSIQRQAQRLLDRLSASEDESYVLAELHDLLSRVQKSELERVFCDPLRLPSSPCLQNQIAAMLELAAHRCGAHVPTWVSDIPPLSTPYFATSLIGLRLHLLANAPPPFRRRNLFVDSSLGDRV